MKQLDMKNEDNMTDYEVFASKREHGCDGGDITGLAIREVSQMWDSTKIISMIEHGDKFWSNIYRKGIVERHTRIEVEVINDRTKGKYLRTKADSTDKNNLLELPIYNYNSLTGRYEPCL